MTELCKKLQRNYNLLPIFSVINILPLLWYLCLSLLPQSSFSENQRISFVRQSPFP